MCQYSSIASPSSWLSRSLRSRLAVVADCSAQCASRLIPRGSVAVVPVFNRLPIGMHQSSNPNHNTETCSLKREPFCWGASSNHCRCCLLYDWPRITSVETACHVSHGAYKSKTDSAYFLNGSGPRAREDADVHSVCAGTELHRSSDQQPVWRLRQQQQLD